MWKWFKQYFNKSLKPSILSDKENSLDLERQIRQLQIELQECDHLIATLKHDLAKQEATLSSRVNESIHGQIERLLTDVANPVSQLLTQAHLHAEGKPVQVKDVLTVVKRLIHVLEDFGLTIEGNVGEAVTFDPNRHEPLTLQQTLRPGENVIIRFVGLSYQGRFLQKARVQKKED